MTEKLNIKILRDNLAVVIQDEIANLRLQQELIKEFSSKGLNIDIPYMLFNKQLTIDEIEDTNELIALSKVIFTFMQKSNKELVANVNPQNFFTDIVLTKYDVYVQPKREEEINTLVFEGCRQIDDGTYLTYIKAPQWFEIRKANKLANMEGIQRARRIETLPSGQQIEKINVNKEGIKELRERFKEHNIKPTTVALTVLDIPDKKPGVDFKCEYSNNENGIAFGRFEVTPNFDASSPDYTPFIINDGFHRFTAICDEYLDNITIGDEGLAALIFIMTPDEARRYTADTFKQNASILDKKYAETLRDTAGNKFIRNIVSNSNILRGKVSNTFNSCRILKSSLTYLSVLDECVKYTNVDIKNQITASREAKKIAKVIDVMIEYLLSTYFNNNIDEMKNHNFLLNANTFVGYLAIANELKNDEEFELKAGDIADKLIKIDSNLNKELKLDHSNCDIKAIYEYFQNVTKEEI